MPAKRMPDSPFLDDGHPIMHAVIPSPRAAARCRICSIGLHSFICLIGSDRCIGLIHAWSMRTRLIASSELARELGVSRSTIARWVQNGWIKPALVTAGGQARFDLDDIKEQL
ncbi:helix-turn-helix domain-containing protein, partial [Saccharopolyspora rectivirgula]|uniref:helix-turn-helix domain-containing protein n=1 Tax=Saccharopolyspora rectivirgula TaxID=28042 RepID=UPI002E811522